MAARDVRFQTTDCLGSPPGQGGGSPRRLPRLRRIGRHLQNRGSLNGQLAGVLIESLNYSGIVAILSASDIPPGVLEHVQKELASSFDLNRQVIDLDCEKVFWYDRIQRTFTDDGKGEATPCPADSPMRRETGKTICLARSDFTIRIGTRRRGW